MEKLFKPKLAFLLHQMIMHYFFLLFEPFFFKDIQQLFSFHQEFIVPILLLLSTAERHIAALKQTVMLITPRGTIKGDSHCKSPLQPGEMDIDSCWGKNWFPVVAIKNEIHAKVTKVKSRNWSKSVNREDQKSKPEALRLIFTWIFQCSIIKWILRFGECFWWSFVYNHISCDKRLRVSKISWE